MTAPDRTQETTVTSDTKVTIESTTDLVVDPGPAPSTGITDGARLNPPGDPRALLATRVLAAIALLVAAGVHARLAGQAGQAGLAGPLLGRSHLFLLYAVLSAVLAAALLVWGGDRSWLVAVVLSTAGLVAILSSVYAPLPAVGPLPTIDEPVWLLSKGICALAEVTVISLWLVRAIAPASPSR